jgi:hypothetical protein
VGQNEIIQLMVRPAPPEIGKSSAPSSNQTAAADSSDPENDVMSDKENQAVSTAVSMKIKPFKVFTTVHMFSILAACGADTSICQMYRGRGP